MKKASALAMTALLMGMAAHAQDTKKFRLGITLAPNMGWIGYSDKKVENNSYKQEYKADGSRIGFRFGLVTDFQLGANANYFFSTGLFLNNLGGKSVVTTKLAGNDSLFSNAKVEAKFQYVELPLSIKLKTNEIGYMTYFGQLGFDVGVLTGAKARVEGGDFEDVKDDVFPMRVALAVGGGLEYNFSGNTSALIGIKYSNSFMNLYQKDTKLFEGTALETKMDLPKGKLHYAELTVGVLF